MTKARTDQPDASTDLSEAARAVVRDAGDPRIDAHLRALGLAMDEDGAPVQVAEAAPLVPVMAPEPAAAVELRGRVTELEAALAASASRVRLLTGALVAAGVAIVVLGALLIVR